MSTRPKRRLDDFEIANASDPDDGDWEAGGSPKPQRRSKVRHSKGSRPKKRMRRGYQNSDDDIVDDDDDVSEESFLEGSEIESEEEVELNPRTGRPSRSATKKEIKYEESEDEIEDTGNSDEESDVNTGRSRRGKSSKPSLIIKLPVAAIETRMRSRGGKREPTPGAHGMRRSSRLSHDPEETLLELTNSGRHTQIARAGTQTPEPEVGRGRATRGAKGLVGGKRPPSAIMEASQENSGNSGPTNDMDMEELVEDPEAEDSVLVMPKAEVQASENASEAGFEMQDAQQEPEDTQVEEGVIAESIHEEEGAEDEDSDEGPVARGGRNLRSRQKSASQSKSSAKRRREEESSDFEPPVDDDKDGDVSDSEDDLATKRQRKSSTESVGGRRSKRLQHTSRGRRGSDSVHSDELDLDRDELAEEAEELAEDNSRRRRTTRRQPTYDDQPRLRNRGPKPDYRVFRPEIAEALTREEEDDPMPAATPSRNRRGGASGPYRNLFPLAGPFGGGGPAPLFGGPEGTMATGGVDSDSSDDDLPRGVGRGVGGAVGMTPTSANMPNLFPQPQGGDGMAGGVSGGPAGLGKIKDRKALADADPLGVAQDITFDAVGGLDDHINKLKEMVMLPLLYPEVFKQFNATPPRGVLFHGPPGTGKTLLARALASSVSSSGQKVTFYMRKGADALSKWVGEAERQLRLLFEEARKNQPSIIFFDEIDGLAPVRSSKQEQIHASIVATLLALMDGMDGRGQVIVIGATNRPDSVDPALRRPGRFDREFYFPLPDIHARRSIINIHTKGWEPPLPGPFKDHLAEITNGYGGADLRALCAEAALNAIQGTFPQIYKSEKKLIIDPTAIKVKSKDFMISVNKMIPSSERAGHARGAPLAKRVEPLLRHPLAEISKIIDDIMPKKRKLTALEEAEYDDREDDAGFDKEIMAKEFERSRVFRPRLLIRGLYGMGQGYLGEALLHKFEDLFVQSFDIATLFEESSRSPEAAVIQLFKEIRRHKPSVIFIPNVDVWYHTVPPAVIKTFTGLLQSLRPDEPVLVLGIMEASKDGLADPAMLRDLFGFSMKNVFDIQRPGEAARREYFDEVIKFIRMPPSDFPHQENRKKRELPELPVAPEKKVEGPTKDQQKMQKKQDRITLNNLKVVIQPVMDQIKRAYKKFRTPIVDPAFIEYLFDEQDPNNVASDVPPEQRPQPDFYRPYELSRDEKGEPGLREVATGKFFYNLEIVMIEKRLSNGYYKRPRDFLGDIKRLAKDARTSGDEERTLKANELVANVEVDMAMIERTNPDLVRECEAVYAREKAREKEALEKAKKEAEATGQTIAVPSNVPQVSATTTTDATGPIQLGEQVPGPPTIPPITPLRNLTSLSNGDTQHGEENSHPLSNGEAPASHPNEDTPMTDAPQAGEGLSAPNTQTQQRSQVSAVTYLPPGSHPADYHNSASTTTSGQKTDKSNRSSGPFNTQSTNGVSEHPDFSAMQPGGTQSIPDTQELSSLSQHTHSQPSQASSQLQNLRMGPPSAKPHNSTINALLNSDPPTPSHPAIVIDEAHLKTLHQELTRRCSGLSVEQLEQVNATIMDTIWKQRNVWNRVQVAHTVQAAFNEVIEDIKLVQSLLPPSQKSQIIDPDDDGR